MKNQASPTKSIVTTNYTPRTHQMDLHRKLRRFSVILCHRRFGKTVFALNHLINQALKQTKPMPRYAYIAPTYQQAKMVAWDYLKKYTETIPNVTYNEAELRCDFGHNQARVQLLSGENPDRLKGIYLDGAVLDEYASMNPTVWSEAVRPTLSDRPGWALFIGTVKGQNHFWELYQYACSHTLQDWFGANFRASDTQILPKSELEAARAVMSEAEYMQEYENDPTAGLVGAYFSKELARATEESRITSVVHDPMLQVDTYWDLGMNDATAIWFCQSYRNQHRMINYKEFSGESIHQIIAEIRKSQYNFGRFNLPHDSKVRDLSTGKARVQTFYELGCRNIRVIPRVGTKIDSINAARVALQVTWFDADQCSMGLKALANYQKKWDSKNNVFQNSPLHNWASNGADAFQQFGLGVRADSGTALSEWEEGRDDGPGVEAETEYSVYGGR